MSEFELPHLYLKPLDPRGDVTHFGKSPEMEANDTAAGIARIGGSMRSPSYIHAYLRGADILVKEGLATATLDDIALPAFYMQRHTLELLLKQLLGWVDNYERAKTSSQDQVEKPNKKGINTHVLGDLLEQLEIAIKKHDFTALPTELNDLVQRFNEIDRTIVTWSRFSSYWFDKKEVTHHKEETIVPIVELQKELQRLVSKVIYSVSNQDAYEIELHNAWVAASDLI